MFTVEPETVSPESAFESEVLSSIESMLSKSGCKYFCIPKFGVDAAFFIETQGRSHLRLLEFKCYGGARQGGVGFGNSKGFGPQVEILKQDSEKLSLTNPYVRWVLVNSLLPYGSERYAFFDCAVAKASAMGKEIIHGKQNNLRISQLSTRMMSWERLLQEIYDFLVL